MNADWIGPAIAALASLTGGALGAGVAARLALRHYYSQRVWDRRADVYSRIFEALDGEAEWYRICAQELSDNRMVPVEIENERIGLVRAARIKLREELARETLIIPDKMHRRIDNMYRDLEFDDPNNWSANILRGLQVTESAIEDIRNLARLDLHIGQYRG